MAKAGGRSRTSKSPSAKKPVGRVDPSPGKYASEEEANLYDDYARKHVNIPPPKKISEIVNRLLTNRGYANVQAKAELEAVWQLAAGPLISKHTRPGSIQRGTWEIIVRSSSLLQELSFQQTTILRAVQQAVPQHKIKKLRFRVGPVD